MADTTDAQADLKDPVVMTEEERIAMEERKAAKSWQYGQQGSRIDTTIGSGGAPLRVRTVNGGVRIARR